MARRVVAASFVLAAWSAAAACSDTNVTIESTGGPPDAVAAGDASETSTGSDAAVDVDSALVDSAGADSADGALDAPNDGNADADAADCSKSPILHDTSMSFFCAFTAAGENQCANDATCCNPAKNAMGVFPISFCGTGKNDDTTCAAEAAGHASTYTPGSSWECADKNACDPGEVCCLIQDPARLADNPPHLLNIANTPLTDPSHPPACGVKRSYNEGGTRCRATACDAGEIKLCSLSDANCAAGTTCKPFIAGFRDVGYCN